MVLVVAVVLAGVLTVLTFTWHAAIGFGDGSTSAVSGKTVKVTGQGFMPGGHITLTVDDGQPVVSGSGIQGASLAARASSPASATALQLAQNLPQNGPIPVAQRIKAERTNSFR